MRAGQLRHRVTIVRQVEVDDGHHGFTSDEATVASRIEAHVRALTGRELERAQQIDPRTNREVCIRKRRDIRAGQTVVFHDPDLGDRSMEIVAPPLDRDEQRRELLLLCREAAA